MAHAQQMNFVSAVVKHFIRGTPSVIEIGSYDVNGSVRSFFSGCKYVGVDLIPGPGVDLVSSGHEVSLPGGSFDVAISCECFEHNPYWRETFLNMQRLSRDFVVFSCASTGRAVHGVSHASAESSPGTVAMGSDYYRNLTADDFYGLTEAFSQCAFFYEPTHCDLYFVGWKRGERDLRDFAKDVRSITTAHHPPLVRALTRSLPIPVYQRLRHAYGTVRSFINGLH